MKELLEQIRQKAKQELAAAEDSKGLEELRVRYLGKKGELTAILKQMGALSAEERPVIGQLANQIRAEIETELKEADAHVKQHMLEKKLASETIDVTLPGTPCPTGKEHPLSLVLNEVEDIFIGMGFSIAEGPEVETDYYNFEALNLPKDHPARDTQDTFYITDNVVLRTHTSPMQARTMLAKKPPLRLVVPGKVFRSDDDSTHSPMFNQIEGLVVDKKVSLCDLKGALEEFAKAIFSPETKVRFRPSYFPFTEPSVEVDVSCAICGGKGCRVCKHTGWIEILGAGIVNPQVLINCGLDPQKYSGYAFGLGIERVTMIKYGIPDIRLLFENDSRFLNLYK